MLRLASHLLTDSLHWLALYCAAAAAAAVCEWHQDPPYRAAGTHLKGTAAAPYFSG
jgi:hypothetical protein